MKSITFDDIKMLLLYAFQEFYTNERDLLDYQSMDKAADERCMVFHIGWYMLAYMKQSPLFNDIQLDCEYNRLYTNPKIISVYQSNKKKKETIRIIPDMILHKRLSCSDNVLVIEFKKGSPDDRKKDERKLRCLTDPCGDFAYQYGLYIELDKQEIRCNVFQNGEHISRLDFIWKFNENQPPCMTQDD